MKMSRGLTKKICSVKPIGHLIKDLYTRFQPDKLTYDRRSSYEQASTNSQPHIGGLTPRSSLWISAYAPLCPVYFARILELLGFSSATAKFCKLGQRAAPPSVAEEVSIRGILYCTADVCRPLHLHTE